MNTEREFHRGDVFVADFGIPFGSEQGGRRPVVIMQNDTGCFFSPTVTMVPLTANLKKLQQPTHRILKNTPFLRKQSMVLGEQIDTIDKRRMLFYIGKLSEEDMNTAAEAVKEHLGFYIPECIDAP